MPSTQNAGLLRARASVALCRERLAGRGAVRIGRALAVLVAAGFAAAAVVLRLADGAEARLEGLTAGAAPWVAWLTAVPLALAAAEDRAAIDRREGVEALAAARGLSPAGLESARALAAMTAIARSIGFPLVALALLTAALAGRGAVAVHRVADAAGAVLFAIAVGVTVGGTAAACGRVGRARGRWLFAAVIVAPWVLSDLAGRGGWSIPGALDAVMTFVFGGAGA